MDDQSKAALDKADQLIKEATEVLVNRLTELSKELRRSEMDELVETHAQRERFQQHLDAISDAMMPSIAELNKAHAAESEKISQMIEDGDDFSEEMRASPVLKVFGPPHDRLDRKPKNDKDSS